MNDIIEMFMNIKFEVESKFDEIQQVELDEKIKIHPEGFEKAESFKWEKGVQILANLGGAFIIFASGPIGWVGLAIYGLFSLAGLGIKKAVQTYRANNVKKQIAPRIDEIERKLMKIILEKYNEFVSSCNLTLDNILKYREDQLKNLKESLSMNVDNSQETTLKADLEYIINKQKEI